MTRLLDPTRRAFLAAKGAVLLTSDTMRSQDPPLSPRRTSNRPT